MQHSFEVEDAVKYGIEKAIILNNLRFWLEKNRANRKNISDGQVWTYNSAEAFELLFPYMKARTIARYLRELEFDGVIISGVNSDNKLDRTKWYSTPDYSITKCDIPLSQNGESAESEFAYSNLTICDNVTDINKQIVNTDIKQESKDLVPSVKNASTPVSSEQLFEVSLLLKNGEKFNPTVNQVRSWVETYKMPMCIQSWRSWLNGARLTQQNEKQRLEFLGSLIRGYLVLISRNHRFVKQDSLPAINHLAQ